MHRRVTVYVQAMCHPRCLHTPSSDARSKTPRGPAESVCQTPISGVVDVPGQASNGPWTRGRARSPARALGKNELAGIPWWEDRHKHATLNLELAVTHTFAAWGLLSTAQDLVTSYLVQLAR
jgi:hypothetical protein